MANPKSFEEMTWLDYKLSHFLFTIGWDEYWNQNRSKFQKARYLLSLPFMGACGLLFFASFVFMAIEKWILGERNPWQD